MFVSQSSIGREESSSGAAERTGDRHGDRAEVAHVLLHVPASAPNGRDEHDEVHEHHKDRDGQHNYVQHDLPPAQVYEQSAYASMAQFILEQKAELIM